MISSSSCHRLLSFVILCGALVQGVECWVSVPTTTGSVSTNSVVRSSRNEFLTTKRTSAIPRRSLSFPLRASSSEESASSSNPISNLGENDIIYQRVFYRLSSASQVQNYKALVVEELVRFKKSSVDAESIVPIGPRTLLLRDGDVEDGEIGDIVYKLDVSDHTDSHNGAGMDKNMEATICMILYLTSNSNLVFEGNVLELSCNLGLATLLSAIAANKLEEHKQKPKTPAASSTDEETSDDTTSTPEKDSEEDETEDCLSIQKQTALPKSLQTLFLSDIDEKDLEIAVSNVKKANVPTTQVSFGQLNWRLRSSTGGPVITGPGGSVSTNKHKEYHTIVGCNLDLDFPTTKELARTVAYRLEPSSPYNMNEKKYTSSPVFIHLSRDDIYDDKGASNVQHLQRFFQKGYKMETQTGYIKLEKIMFAIQSLPAPTDAKDAADEIMKLDKLDLEVQQYKDSIYKSFIANHSPNYASGMGEYFFPMETGEFDNDVSARSKFLEPDTDSPYGGGGGGGVGGRGTINPF